MNKLTFEQMINIVMTAKGDNQNTVAEKIGKSQGALNNILKRRTINVPLSLKKYVMKGINEILIDGLGIELAKTYQTELDKTIERAYEDFQNINNT